jgi:hypothetical protein
MLSSSSSSSSSPSLFGGSGDGSGRSEGGGVCGIGARRRVLLLVIGVLFPGALGAERATDDRENGFDMRGEATMAMEWSKKCLEAQATSKQARKVTTSDVRLITCLKTRLSHDSHASSRPSCFLEAHLGLQWALAHTSQRSSRITLPLSRTIYYTVVVTNPRSIWAHASSLLLHMLGSGTPSQSQWMLLAICQSWKCLRCVSSY